MKQEITPLTAGTHNLPSVSSPALRQAPTLMIISPFDEDHACLARILNGSVRRLYSSRTGREGLACLRRMSAPVIICEQHLPDGDWKIVLDQAERMPCRPLLIVASRLADARLWAEVLNVGGRDLLGKPFDKNEVMWVVEQAWRQWRQQRAPASRKDGWAAAHA